MCCCFLFCGDVVFGVRVGGKFLSVVVVVGRVCVGVCFGVDWVFWV